MRKTSAVLALLVTGALAGPATTADAAIGLVAPGPVTVVVSGQDTVLTLDVTSSTGSARLYHNGVFVNSAKGHKNKAFRFNTHLSDKVIHTCGTQTGWALKDKSSSTLVPIKLRFLCRSRFDDVTFETTQTEVTASATLKQYDPGTSTWVASANRTVHLQQQGRPNTNLDEMITDAEGDASGRGTPTAATFYARITTPATHAQGGTSTVWTPLALRP